MAARTRSVDSFTAASGRPTNVTEGRERELRSVSTSTIAPSRPMRAQLWVLASIDAPGAGGAKEWV